LHDRPDIPERGYLGYLGNPRIQEAMLGLKRPLVIRGHAHWQEALAELPNGLQIWNVDKRVVILRADA